jgi:anaerobic magnesium-protoporphyrin IX monomethyl ester cyclase
MTDILFTHSYFLRFDPKEYEAMMPYPPLGTLYAAAAARTGGYTVALFDSMLASSESDIRPLLQRHRPRVVVIYDDDFNYLTKMCLTRMREAAFALSAYARESGCTVVVHGSDPADHVQSYLDHGADYVICGEGEETLKELLASLLRSRRPPEEIRGLAFRSASGLVRTPRREVIKDLDALPLPARDLLDVDLYRRAWTERHGYFSLNMVTTRGCPFHCNWCAKPLYGQVYNSRSPRGVVDEILELKQTLKPDHLWFCDDIFGLKPGWVQEFSRLAREQKAILPFKCLARVDMLLKEDMIGHLAGAGCTTVWVGAESGSQKILDAMDKGTTVEQIASATNRLKSAGIRVGFFLQFGYPGETREDIAKTLAMVRRCMPDDIGISVSYPLPGTRFYDSVAAQLSDKKNWVDSQDLAMMFRGRYVPDFYRALHRLTHKSFRLWQGWETAKTLAKHPWSVDRPALRRIAASAYHALTLPPLRLRLERLSGKEG